MELTTNLMYPTWLLVLTGAFIFVCWVCFGRVVVKEFFTKAKSN